VSKRDAQADLALMKAATPGPWWWRRKGYLFEMSDVFSGVDSGYDQWFNSPTDEDAAFIAACPEMVEHWIDRAVEAEAELSEVRDDRLSYVFGATARQETLRTALRDAAKALEWLMHLAYGVGKGGDERGPEPGEFEAAMADGATALSRIKEVLP
jgi:hypothetical protein